MTVWHHLPLPSADEQMAAQALLDEYTQHGFIRRTPTAMLHLSDATITAFYRALANTRSADSPVQHQPDSAWMLDASFCFIHVRATGVGAAPGNFIQAAKLLPCLRADAIHLAPFTSYYRTYPYAVRSVRTIDHRLVHPALALSPEDQLRALVEAAHLLGKTIGFDLEPHTAQYSASTLMHPEAFRWIKLAPDKHSLADGLDADAMLDEPMQARIVEEVQTLVGAAMQAEGLVDLDEYWGDSAETRQRKHRLTAHLIGALIERGCWTIPAQSWVGVGVPRFRGYHAEKHYPLFDYRQPNGDDPHDRAYHILTPIKLYTGMRTNRPPEAIELYAPGIDFYADIFCHWRDHFGFDFIRHDSADHIVDSLVDGSVPASDRPSPEVLRMVNARSRAHKPYIGNLAERMGEEVEDYAAMDYDLMLGADMLPHPRIDAAYLERCFRLHDRLTTLNTERARPFGVTFAVDTHDTGHEHSWGAPLVKVVGARQMRLRHFLSRFLDVGAAHRPKYEAMGSQDLSYGLHESNTHDVNLVWAGNDLYNQGYHWLEDSYTCFQPLLTDGEIVRRAVESTHAWWLIRSGETSLLALVTFDAEPIIDIDLRGVLSAPSLCQAHDYDFVALTEACYPLAEAHFHFKLPAESARLIIITAQRLSA